MIEIPLKQTWYDLTLDTQLSDELMDSATSYEIIFKSPSDVEFKKTAERVDGTSQIKYTLTIDKDVLNKLGKWSAWPYITGPDGRVAESRRAISITVIEDGTV